MKTLIESYNNRKRSYSYTNIFTSFCFFMLALSAGISGFGFTFIFISVFYVYKFTQERKIQIPLSLIVPEELLYEIDQLEQKLNDELDRTKVLFKYKYIIKIAEDESKKIKDRVFFAGEQ